MQAVLTTSISGFGPPRRGKVREVYDVGSALLFIATDRISAFDVVMANGIPDKGKVLNQMSAFWFEKLRNIVPNHMISIDDAVISEQIGIHSDELTGRSMLVKKAKTVPIECVARGYITGSLYKEYRREGGSVHSLGLADGLVDSSKLSEPIFTPATKAETGHDENISFQQMVDELGMELATQLKDWTLELYLTAAKHAESKGILLADTKFEFGWTDDGVILIDEVLTPDSSRYWAADKYQPGKSQESYDKQFVRDYLETLDWDKTPPGPELPAEIITKTRDKYLEAFERITGRDLILG